MASNAVNAAYKPSTIWRDNMLTPSEKKHHPVCSVWPEAVSLPHPAFGTHVIVPGRPGKNDPPQPGARNNHYGFVLCPPGINRLDLGMVQTLAMRDISAKRVAMDVIGLSVDGVDETPRADGKFTVVAPAITTSDLFEKGYFVPEDVEPTDAEIEAAETRRDRWLVAAVEKGNRVWNNSGGKSDQIHPDSILAARYLGADVPWAPNWAKAKTDQVSCPVCLKPITRGVRKCSSCAEWLGYEADGSVYAVNDPARQQQHVKAPAVDDVQAEIDRIKKRALAEKLDA